MRFYKMNNQNQQSDNQRQQNQEGDNQNQQRK